jgi:hypothetical protein
MANRPIWAGSGRSEVWNGPSVREMPPALGVRLLPLHFSGKGNGNNLTPPLRHAVKGVAISRSIATTN